MRTKGRELWGEELGIHGTLRDSSGSRRQKWEGGRKCGLERRMLKKTEKAR